MFTPTPTTQHPHYYGNIVRYIFLVTALILILSLPIVSSKNGSPTALIVMSIAILVIASGLTTRLQKIGVVIDFIIATIGFFITENSSLAVYHSQSYDGKIFTTYLFLSILFLFAIYFSIRSIIRLYFAKT